MNTKRTSSGHGTSFQRYLSDIDVYPLLSAEEEIDLVKRIKEGDKTAMEKLINSNLRYVVKVAYKYKKGEEGLMELISEGNQGLLMAAKRFDGSSGNRFTTYATYWIQKYILEYLAQSHGAVYIPKYKAESLQRVKKALELFEQRHARTPRPQELAGELKMEVEDVLFLLGLAQQTKAFNAPIKIGEENQEITFSDVYLDDDGEETDHRLEQESLTTDLFDTLNLLNEREKNVLICLYGIGREKLTQEEVSKKLGISLTRVWQIKDRALHKLKVEGYYGNLKAYLEK